MKLCFAMIQKGIAMVVVNVCQVLTVFWGYLPTFIKLFQEFFTSFSRFVISLIIVFCNVNVKKEVSLYVTAKIICKN